jgi:hypothetical protein
MAKKIEIDPFFDKTARAEVSDKPLSIPSSSEGLAGTIIPSAAEGDAGSPEGWTGTANVRTEIHVDPDIPGQSFVVKTEDLNPKNIEEAMSTVGDEDPRIRASAVYNAVATREDRAELGPLEEEDPGVRVVNPLKAFESTGDVTPSAEVVRVAPLAPADVVVAPQKWVTFEIEGFGEHKAPYHRVIRNNNTLVLVYDTSCASSQKFFPRATDKPMGVHVTGSSVVYYAHTTGIEFSDGDVEFCVLLIEQEAPFNSDSEEPRL